jgi:hypothetical protein
LSPGLNRTFRTEGAELSIYPSIHPFIFGFYASDGYYLGPLDIGKLSIDDAEWSGLWDLALDLTFKQPESASTKTTYSIPLLNDEATTSQDKEREDQGPSVFSFVDQQQRC